MIKLEKQTIEKIISDCKNELQNAERISFRNVNEVKEKIKIYECGIVYFIFSNEELKYIGKSKGKYFRSRMKSHFFGIGKGTKSKNDFIKSEEKEKKITLKFIKTEPESLRNLIEEELIKKFKDGEKWNYK